MWQYIESQKKNTLKFRPNPGLKLIEQVREVKGGKDSTKPLLGNLQEALHRQVGTVHQRG